MRTTTTTEHINEVFWSGVAVGIGIVAVLLFLTGAIAPVAKNI